MPDPICLTLAGAVIPDSADVMRDHVRAPARRSAHYMDRYDRRTLFYDCVYRTDLGGYLFTAPRFLNLWSEFRDRIRLDGVPVANLSRKNHQKYEQVVVKSPRSELSLDWKGGGWSIPARSDVAAQFTGLNTVVTVNKNNDLAWIRDWLRFHVDRHGLQAALIFDNGSTRYSQQALADTAGTCGLQQVCIASADYPYGPRDSGKGREIRPKFLQPALLNLARTDILRTARAVLNVDIDELVLRRNGPSVFDRAVQSWSGAVRLPGQWAYPSPSDPAPTPHAAHLWRVQNTTKRSNPKWCAVPNGHLSRLGWFVHHVGGEAFRLLADQKDCEFIHCRGTSTGWKGNRFDMPDPLDKDPELETLFRAFPVAEPRLE